MRTRTSAPHDFVHGYALAVMFGQFFQDYRRVFHARIRLLVMCQQVAIVWRRSLNLPLRRVPRSDWCCLNLVGSVDNLCADEEATWA